jgi:hypothetical protein
MAWKLRRRLEDHRRARSVCEGCQSIGDDRDWIGHVVKDAEVPEVLSYVYYYCPRCAEQRFGRQPRAA